MSTTSFKVKCADGTIRRFSLQLTAEDGILEQLKAALQERNIPDGQIFWIDEERDLITITTDGDVREAVSGGQLVRLQIVPLVAEVIVPDQPEGRRKKDKKKKGKGKKDGVRVRSASSSSSSTDSEAEQQPGPSSREHCRRGRAMAPGYGRPFGPGFGSYGGPGYGGQQPGFVPQYGQYQGYQGRMYML